jgi:hypothetical protein
LPPGLELLTGSVRASGHQASTSRELMIASKPGKVFTGVSTLQHFSIGITNFHNDFILPQATSWKHNKFLSFQMAQQIANESMFTTPNPELHSQHLAMDSKSIPILKPVTSKTAIQACLATTQSKNRRYTDSISVQNKQVLSSTFLLLSRLSLVNNLFLESSHKKKCTLGGTMIFQIAGT